MARSTLESHPTFTRSHAAKAIQVKVGAITLKNPKTTGSKLLG